MRKKFLILPFIVFILSLFSLLSAGAPDTLWTRTYGGTGDDFGASVQQTSDGGFIIAGSATSLGAGGRDVYLIRTDQNGDTIWTKTYGGTEDDYGNSVQQTIDGGFIITGSTESFGPYPIKLYLLRTDSNGDTIWTKTYARAVISEGRSVKQITDRGYIIAGYDYGNDSTGSQVYILKTDTAGDTIWTKTYGGTDSDEGYSVQQTTDEGFIITGYTASFGAGATDVYLIKTNSKRDTLWTKTYGGTNYDYGRSVQQTSDGGFIIAGDTKSFGVGQFDFYLIRTDSNGDTLWTKTYVGTAFDQGYSVNQTSDNGFIIAGATDSSNMFSYVYLIRTNPKGEILWTKTCGGIKEDWSFSCQQTTDGGFVVVGFTESFGSGGSDVYLIRLDKDTTAIQQEISSNYIKPNNFIISYNNGNISIRYTIPHSSSVKLSAYDTQGKLVKVIQDKFMQKGSYSVRWDSNRFGSGVYFLKLSVNGTAVSKKITIIK